MEFFFEALLQFCGEILLQMLFELLVELGCHKISDGLKQPKQPILSVVGFTVLGLLSGGISLLIFPNSAIHEPIFRRLNLVVTPAIVGLIMATIGKARVNKGQNLVRLDRFGYAFVFAFFMALIRFFWAN